MPPRRHRRPPDPKPPPQATIWTWLHLGFWLVLLAAVLPYLLAGFISRMLGGDYWWTYAALAASLLVGLPAAFLLFVFGSAFWNLLRFQNEARDFALAREVTGDEGSVARSGNLTAWFEGEERLAFVLAQEEAARVEFEAVLGVPPAVKAPVRLFCFETKSGYAAYVQKLALTGGNIEGMFLSGKPRRIALCAEREIERPLDPQRLLRVLFGYYFLEQLKGFLPNQWMLGTVCTVIATGGDRAELARLNRRMLAALAAKRALSADQLFCLPQRKLIRIVQTWHTFESYAFFLQYISQLRSVGEYLLGKDAPLERRQAVRAFVKEVRRRSAHEELFARHVGRDFAGVIDDWQEWVRSQGLGKHEPPAPAIRDALLKHVLPFLHDARKDPQEKILAIRDLAGAGYLLGADELIELLRYADDDFRRELVYALESISGIIAGDRVEPWEDWWRRMLVAEPGET